MAVTSLGNYIQKCIEEHEEKKRMQLLCSLPENTFQALYEEQGDIWAGVVYNGIYYSEWEIYIASHARDSYAEVLL